MKLHHFALTIGMGLAVLSGCASTNTSNTEQAASSASMVAKPQERVLGYFDSEGNFSRSDKSGNGYTRKLLGTTADGRSVLQDFYNSNGKAQTSPFVLFDDAGLESWDSLPFTDGDIVFFNADGHKSSQATLKQGTFVGNHPSYHLNGKVFLDERSDAEGNSQQSVYFDDQGKRLFAVEFDPSGDAVTKISVYDGAGKAHAARDNEALTQAAAKKIAVFMHQLASREAALAGQDSPEFEDVILPSMD